MEFARRLYVEVVSACVKLFDLRGGAHGSHGGQIVAELELVVYRERHPAPKQVEVLPRRELPTRPAQYVVDPDVLVHPGHGAPHRGYGCPILSLARGELAFVEVLCCESVVLLPEPRDVLSDGEAQWKKVIFCLGRFHRAQPGVELRHSEGLPKFALDPAHRGDVRVDRSGA